MLNNGACGQIYPSGTQFCIVPVGCITIGDATYGYPDTANKRCASANVVTNKRVKGTEINYGFWSKNSPRNDSFADLFKDHYHRDPTSSELSSITDVQATLWFNEKYTDHSWFGDYAPTDVQVVSEQSGGQVCFDGLTSPVCNIWEPVYTGEIIFPNGTKCEIMPIYWSDISSVPGQYNLKVKPPCAGCN